MKIDLIEFIMLFLIFLLAPWLSQGVQGVQLGSTCSTWLSQGVKKN